MDGLLLVLGVAGVLLLALAPLFLPWPQHARWLVTTQPLDPAGHLQPEQQFREVTIVTTTRCGDEVEICVVERGAHLRHAVALVGTSLLPGAITTLNGWFAAEIPLLMLVGADQQATLYGPKATVTGLRRPGHRAPAIESDLRDRAAS